MAQGEKKSVKEKRKRKKGERKTTDMCACLCA